VGVCVCVWVWRGEWVSMVARGGVCVDVCEKGRVGGGGVSVCAGSVGV